MAVRYHNDKCYVSQIGYDVLVNTLVLCFLTMQRYVISPMFSMVDGEEKLLVDLCALLNLLLCFIR